MISYWIYLIKDEVRNQFFEHPEKIVELLREYENAGGTFKEILEKQFEYITLPIPITQIHDALFLRFTGRLQYKAEKRLYLISGKNQDEEVALIVHNRRIMVLSKNNNSFLDKVFKALSSVSTNLLTVDSEFRNFGWYIGNKRKENISKIEIF